MNTTTKKTALLLSFILLFICASSILYLLLAPQISPNKYTAYIYVQGKLYEAIDLSQVTESYEYTISCQTGGYNTIRIEPGAISISSADCPDKVCVKQGSITNALLPITCLPHNVVIELKASDNPLTDVPDGVTH